MTNLFLFLLFITSLPAMAEVRLKVMDRIPSDRFKLAAGSKVELSFLEENKKISGLFLGRMEDHPDLGTELLILNLRTNKVVLVDDEELKSSSAKKGMQPLVSTIDQTGDTCAAYAIYHFWQQSNEIGKGNEALSLAFSQERSRMKLLEESITRYYMGRTYNLNVPMRHFGKRFGMGCRDKEFSSQEEAIEFVYNSAINGDPVLMEFNIGPKMAESENMLVDYETGDKMDPRLWVPRKKGERNAGGHAIVAAAAFTLKGKKKVLVLDSNWTEPRVWDLESSLGGKTAISEMIFHVCD